MGESNGTDRYVHVYPVGKRARDPRVVALDVSRTAVARAGWICGPATRARVRRADQGEARGKRDGLCRARDYDLCVLHGLSESIQHVSRKLQHLVKKQHAVMSQAHFARARKRASAN